MARPMEINDLFEFERVADPRLSPNGKTVAYTVTHVDVEANKTTTSIWLKSLQGGEPKQLTNCPQYKHDSSPRWSPNGKQILFVSDRSGDNQLWLIDVSGGEAQMITSIATEASDPIWSNDGQQIAFISAVFPEYSEKTFAESNSLNRQRLESQKNDPVKARVFTKLFFRHWDSWVEDKRQHIFVMAAPKAGDAQLPEPADITTGDWDAFPTSSTFSSGNDYCFSPDGSHIVFTAPPSEGEAWNTDYAICRITTGKALKGRYFLDCNIAASSGPQFSPNGKKLAWRSQSEPGYEADRWQITVVDCNKDGSIKGVPTKIEITAEMEMDLSVGSFVWSGNNQICFTADMSGYTPIFILELPRSKKGKAKVTSLGHGGFNGSLHVGGSRLCFLHNSLGSPSDIWVDAAPIQLKVSSKNEKLLADIVSPNVENVNVFSTDGTPMHMIILKPPGFDPNRKWPLAYLVHGGPQGAWDDSWSYRWCPLLWAAQGYVVAMPNPRGSTGYGQKYTDDIRGDWGGQCFDDLMCGLAHLEELPYIDTKRMAAAGASFGGYMMNWFNGNTDKFRTLISHCSVFNFESMWGTTDELWFDEWDHGGLPWESTDYNRFSPHKFAANFKTPMLIIHNDQDFRCPIAEGYQLFTTLQRKGIASRFVNFTNEGHWVNKPANARRWHEEVFQWLAKYCQPGAE